MTFRFIHAADVHLDSPLHGLQRYEGAPVDAIRQATREALRNLVQLAIRKQVDFVIIAGDLYDGDWRDYNTGLFFITQAQKLADAGIPLFLIAGNHDAQNLMTRSLKLPVNTRMLSADEPQTVRLEDPGVAIHGQSFATKAVLDDLSQRYPTGQSGWYNIGVLHTSATGREGHDTYAPCTIEGLKARQYQYWALGHVHQRETLYTDPWITFSGNIQGRHIRETGPKGCWLVTVDDRQQTTARFEPLDVFRWNLLPLSLRNVTCEDDLLTAAEEAFRELDAESQGLPQAVRLQLQGQTELHDHCLSRRSAIVNQLRNVSLQVAPERLWLEKVSFHTRPLRTDDAASDPQHPRHELQTLINELRTQPDAVAELGSDILELFQKLPADVDLTAAGLDISATGWSALLDEAEALLTSRLTGGEEIDA